MCPTDSRLRPDIRKLEQGDIDGAAVEKTRLEEKQRDANKSRKSKKTAEWTPRKVSFNEYILHCYLYIGSISILKLFVLQIVSFDDNLI